MQVLKLGGSALTDKNGYLKANMENIDSLAKMLGKVWGEGRKDIVLIHGAGSFGHPLVVKYALDSGVETEKQRLGAAETHSSCTALSNLIVTALQAQKIPAVSIPPAFLGKLKNRRLVEFNSKPIMKLLKLGYLPVLHGDMMPDSELGCAVCSGDQLASWFGADAKRIILGTNVDGVLANGELVPKINKENFEEVSLHFKPPTYADVTGGMKGKIKELLGLGVPTYIVNAGHPERIEALLKGKTALSTIVE